MGVAIKALDDMLTVSQITENIDKLEVDTYSNTHISTESAMGGVKNYNII